jgi:hypothetical protein
MPFPANLTYKLLPPIVLAWKWHGAEQQELLISREEHCMRNIFEVGLTLIVCSPFTLNAQSLKPLPTEFVDCVTNERGAFVASRKTADASA